MEKGRILLSVEARVNSKPDSGRDSPLRDFSSDTVNLNSSFIALPPVPTQEQPEQPQTLQHSGLQSEHLARAQGHG